MQGKDGQAGATATATAAAANTRYKVQRKIGSHSPASIWGPIPVISVSAGLPWFAWLLVAVVVAVGVGVRIGF